MIEVENLSKAYGNHHAVEGVSFRVGKGEVLGFLGPNGAGKTTTMRILTCFMAPTGGTARVAGFDILNDSLSVRKNIGYLPENVPLYGELSVRDYLGHVAALRGVPKNKRNERLEAALDAGKLEDYADTLIRKLSKGFRQRVGIAQAVVHDPPVLILDEPSAGLDPRQRVETRRLIRSLALEHTVILSTHILPDVQETCDRVVIINNGKIVASDTTENLSHARGDRLKLVLKKPASDAEQKLRQLQNVRDVQHESQPEASTQGGEAFTVEIKNEAARESVARLCVQENWGLLELSPRRSSLEDAFLALTTTDQ